MTITPADVDYLAKLSKLNIPADDKEQVAHKLGAIIEQLQQLQEVDTTDVEATTHVLPLKNIFREDVVQDGLSQAEIEQNAPAYQNGFFQVPRIL